MLVVVDHYTLEERRNLTVPKVLRNLIHFRPLLGRRRVLVLERGGEGATV